MSNNENVKATIQTQEEQPKKSGKTEQTQKEQPKKSGKTERIKIPADPLNPKRKTEDICLNGKFYTIAINQEVDVPKNVAQLLKDIGRI